MQTETPENAPDNTPEKTPPEATDEISALARDTGEDAPPPPPESPEKPADAESPTEDGKPETEEAPLPERILVVEDSPPLRRLLERTLDDAGYEVTVAENGQQALERLRTASRPFDLTLMDIMMPVMDGIKTMATVRKEKLGTIGKVVICSCRSDQETVKLVVKLGAKGYILKPFKTEAVIERVRSVLAGD